MTYQSAIASNRRDTAMTEPTGGTSTDADPTHDALDLLAAGVPLTLVLDLASDVTSEEIYEAEPGSADWLTAPGV
jgi:hypothetical protein